MAAAGLDLIFVILMFVYLPVMQRLNAAVSCSPFTTNVGFSGALEDRTRPEIQSLRSEADIRSEYAKDGKEFCPLNVCCSKFGFCGTTTEFCQDGCQSGCDAIRRPSSFSSCGGTSSSGRYVGYYESWTTRKACDRVHPSNINIKPWTHLIFSFALINEADMTITSMHPDDKELYIAFNGLKQKKPSLKTYIAVGGWDAGGKIFSNMVRFPGTRKSFIDSAIGLMYKYGFDGIDIDWEYPVADDRGGSPADYKNFVTFLKELKDACGSKYGLTATIPASYWYLKGFDIAEMQKHVDWFHMMTYDIHGVWDGNKISRGMDLLWRNNIDPSKVLLGLGFYGRSFQLADASCNTPGCQFSKEGGPESGGADAGMCTGTRGVLSDYEINRILKFNSPEVSYDATAGVKWITWDKDQWVSYDDATTLKQKADLANSMCLGGTFAWAVDLGGPGTLKTPNNMRQGEIGLDGASMDGGSGGSGDVYISPEIYDNDNPQVSCVPPCNLIMPPWTLPTPTTISFPPYITSLEVVWTTTTTITLSNGAISTSTGISRTIQTTTLTIPPVTTSVIEMWNWNITEASATYTEYTLTSSVAPAPFIITNDPNPESSAGNSQPVATRTITPPPYPYSFDTTQKTNLPVITFDVGPPSPKCTSGCGHKCKRFCQGQCQTNCDDGGDDFIDPKDPDPPKVDQCRGPDCHRGKCTGPLCVQYGCKGEDCDVGICVGPRCIPGACSGPNCEKGFCVGPGCIPSGCVGAHCGYDGRCFGPQCISFGCFGQDCSSIGTCTGRKCTPVTCTGPQCQRGVCKGPNCDQGEDECKEKQKAPYCTETVIEDESTSTTQTDCKTVTACSAEPTTITTTIASDASEELDCVYTPAPVADDRLDAIASEIVSRLEERDASRFDDVGTTETISTPTSTTTPTANPTPSVVSYDCKGSILCPSFYNLRAFCDQAKAYLVGNQVYKTSLKDGGGSCYTDGWNAGTGCGVFLQGENCEMTGDQMAANLEEAVGPVDPYIFPMAACLPSITFGFATQAGHHLLTGKWLTMKSPLAMGITPRRY
ncbi:symbiotic chitinase [Microsporum canis CBS 113480]|uniref:chitinase n=1 Tax=Arthroderma otae (strain ATCC MYA-4605 / CBS 113480) TaxID=554155 RepID=C5FN50_ARTOC|nr:symbiotic chitinase [Microsporum canis CBS 113480]EEQ31286.1 symbiotic chitinase [Microsporum canis CBS 113480]